MRSVPGLLSVPFWILVASLLWLPSVETFAAQPRAEDEAGAAVWLESLPEAVAEAKETGRYILVDLYAEWCGWCHKLESSVFSTPAFREYAKDFVLLRVDTEDGGEGSLLKARYNAHSLPTLLVLDADMVRVGAVSGFAPMPEYVSYIQEQINGYLTLVTFYDQVAESRDVELQRKLAEDLHERGDGARAAQLYEKILDRVVPQTEAQAWLLYQTADAWRLGRETSAADEHLRKAYAVAEALENARLVERLDFLSIRVAQDAGDCERTVSSLERFLREHPESLQQKLAERTLEAIKKGDAMECTRS